MRRIFRACRLYIGVFKKSFDRETWKLLFNIAKIQSVFMKSGKKTGVKRFLILFLLMVTGLAIVSQFLYSLYIQLFNDGLITDIQMSLLGDATLATVIGITLVVGIRYILHIISFKQIKI